MTFGSVKIAVCMLRFILFAALNFAALGLGAYLMGVSPASNAWYEQLHKAPWTPPGWVFGAAWFSSMICFAFFMYAITKEPSSSNTGIYLVYAAQWILNVGWNPVFFRWHLVGPGLVVILFLLFTVIYFTRYGFGKQGTSGWLMLPYLVWLLLASSLNAFILVRN
jgi:benzodiazapine receptor